MQEKIARLQSIKVLFVEDEIDLVTIISNTLSKLKANFETAHNGVIALELFKSEGDFDLVVTDINMPVMDGLELIKQIKEINPNMECVIMSAHTEPEYVKKAEKLGVENYLLKPFDFIKFINLVAELDLDK